MLKNDNLFDAKEELSTNSSIESVIINQFKLFYGKTPAEICDSLHLDLNMHSKSFLAVLSTRILGMHTAYNKEAEILNLSMKTIRLRSDGRPKEDMSFRAFKYLVLSEESWEKSEMRAQLSNRFLFVIYQFDSKSVLHLNKVVFWSMPYGDLEGDAKKEWLLTVQRINLRMAHALPKKSETRIMHVRPHAKNAEDKDLSPDGRYLIRKSFFLNASYIVEQLIQDNNK